MIAKSLTVREKVALFCAASDIDHAAVGILASVMHAIEIRGLISREHATRYALTDDGRARPFRSLENVVRPANFRPASLSAAIFASAVRTFPINRPLTSSGYSDQPPGPNLLFASSSCMWSRRATTPASVAGFVCDNPCNASIAAKWVASVMLAQNTANAAQWREIATYIGSEVIAPAGIGAAAAASAPSMAPRRVWLWLIP